MYLSCHLIHVQKIKKLAFMVARTSYILVHNITGFLQGDLWFIVHWHFNHKVQTWVTHGSHISHTWVTQDNGWQNVEYLTIAICMILITDGITYYDM